MPTETAERRHFHRVGTDKPVVVVADGQQHRGQVLDVSLNGLLFQVNDAWRPPLGTALEARIRLDDDSLGIALTGEVAHLEGNQIGLQCLSLDLDSASRLRRLVELNLGDQASLERDLAELITRSRR